MVTLDDVRRIALSLPEVAEAPSYGAPAWRVRKKPFARLRTEHDVDADGEVLVVWVADLEEKEALLAADPAVFTTTPHYDGYPTVLVRLQAVAEDELAELLTDAWRLRAPTRLRAAFEAAGPPTDG
jgi:hypothetical protein